MAVRKKAARRKPARKAAAKKAVRKAAARKPARKKVVKRYAAGGTVSRSAAELAKKRAAQAARKKAAAAAAKKPAKKPAKKSAKKPAKPMRMSSLYNEERKATNMLKKRGQGRRGMSSQDKAAYQKKYDAHKTANPDLYRGPGGALDSWWKKRNPVEPKAPAPAPAPSMMSGGDTPRPDPMAATARAAEDAGSAPRPTSFVSPLAPSSQPIKVGPTKPRIAQDNVSRPFTAEDIAQIVSGKGRKISTGVVNRRKPRRGRSGPGSPMGGTGLR